MFALRAAIRTGERRDLHMMELVQQELKMLSIGRAISWVVISEHKGGRSYAVEGQCEIDVITTLPGKS